MKKVICSIAKAIRVASYTAIDTRRKNARPMTAPMILLSAAELQQVAGGDPNLPKGGW